MAESQMEPRRVINVRLSSNLEMQLTVNLSNETIFGCGLIVVHLRMQFKLNPSKSFICFLCLPFVPMGIVVPGLWDIKN